MAPFPIALLQVTLAYPSPPTTHSFLWPEEDAAYLMDGAGTATQYMFGKDVLFSPVVVPAAPYAFGPGLATKTTWLPPGSWYDTTTGGSLTGSTRPGNHVGTYAISQIPLFYRAGTVIPYLPLRSLPVIGLAASQYSFLGFKIVPGGATGSAIVYEDDGITTAYLSAASVAWTNITYASSTDDSSMVITIVTTGSYPLLPTTRAYQLRVLNGGILASATVNSIPIPFSRFGAIASAGKVTASSQWYWEFSPQQGGWGTLIDLVGVSTSTLTTVKLTFAAGSAPAQDTTGGSYGIIQRAVWAKNQLDLGASFLRHAKRVMRIEVCPGKRSDPGREAPSATMALRLRLPPPPPQIVRRPLPIHLGLPTSLYSHRRVRHLRVLRVRMRMALLRRWETCQIYLH